MGVSPLSDIAPLLIGDEGSAKPIALSDDTFIVGAVVDTNPDGGPQSMRSGMVIALFSFTSSSGASGGLVTSTLSLYHDTAVGMGTEALLKTDTYVYTWAADGANSGAHVLPFTLRAANRYVRAKFKITEGGTITVGTPLGAVAVVFGGLADSPDSAFANAGYEKTIEAE